MKGNHAALMILVILTSSALAFNQQAMAQPGTELGPIITPDCSGGNVGVAFDGTRIIYNCSDRTTLHFTNLAGASLGSLAVTDASGAPVVADALSWDPTENKLWSSRQGGGVCTISSIDMTTGVATDRFSYSSGGCDVSFYDGITVDTVSNTVWTSPDNFATIFHFTKTGTSLGSIDFGSLSAAFDGCSSPHQGGTVGCGNSGLAIGLDGTLFAGTDGVGKIYELTTSAPSITGVFTSVSGRDEDMECGPQFTKSDGSNVGTILSRDFESSSINLLEAPTGTCKSPTVHTTAVGGVILPIDMTSLFVAGAMTNAFWMLPTLGGIAGAALTLFKVKRKHS